MDAGTLVMLVTLGVLGGMLTLLAAGALTAARWARRTGRRPWLWVLLAYAALNVLVGLSRWLLGERF